MGKKFCPQCNMNVHVVRHGGHKCCPCCGFNADYMGPAVCEDYSSSRPPSQQKQLVKPDVHDEIDRSINHQSSASNQASDASVLRGAIIALAIVSFIFSSIALYVSQYTWTLADGSTRVCSVYEIFTYNGTGWIVTAMTLLSLLTIVFAPKNLFLVCILMGIVSIFGAESVNTEEMYGFLSFVVAVILHLLVTKWTRSTGCSATSGIRFAKRFWLGNPLS